MGQFKQQDQDTSEGLLVPVSVQKLTLNPRQPQLSSAAFAIRLWVLF